MAYASLIHVEHAHTNPVMVVFVHMMSECARRQRMGEWFQVCSTEHSSQIMNQASTILFSPHKNVGKRATKLRVRQRFHLAITLHNNPGLILLRKHRLHKRPRADALSEPRTKLSKAFQIRIEQCKRLPYSLFDKFRDNFTNYRT